VAPAATPKAQSYKSEGPSEVEEGKEEPIKAATPEDPGPIATVVSPLAVWQREAERRARNQQMPEELVEVSTPLPADHVALDPTPPQDNFLHKRFALKNYSEFTFVVPPNQASPRLHGFFRSWIDGGSMKDAINVDLLLLNDREFEDFRQGRAGNSTYAVEATHNQAVDYAIASTTGEKRAYHLVFRVPDESRNAVVDANFTLSFE
jgi:hypothetical protein